jgi:hypothetical protein
MISVFSHALTKSLINIVTLLKLDHLYVLSVFGWISERLYFHAWSVIYNLTTSMLLAAGMNKYDFGSMELNYVLEWP